MERSALTKYIWLSIGAALLTIVLKGTAFVMTGSVGVLSDALESLVNVVAALVALAMLLVAAQPPDEEHAYGHAKAEYFSSGVEGGLIVVAALSIGVTALRRVFAPQAITHIGIGLASSLLAGLINLVVARILLRAGQRYRSITLEADAQHLMSDVWTSLGVVVGVGAVAITGWAWLDPLIAFLVAGNIVWTGIQLIRRSALGLLDTALPTAERTLVQGVLDQLQAEGVHYHALRTRQAGMRRFVSVHILVPGSWTVQRGHHLLERIEAAVREVLPQVTVFTHLEPLEDPVSWQDVALDRAMPADDHAAHPHEQTASV